MLIYGVDTEKPITPAIVRDAIIACFTEAHKEVMDMMDEFAEWKSNEEREKFRSIEIKFIVKKAFQDVGVDFEKPTKEGLVKVIDELAKFAAHFRKPEVIQKHYGEIKILIDKCE